MVGYLTNQTLVVNLGGYTKGARNDIFAARPSPVQLQLMGFAGTLAAGNHALEHLEWHNRPTT